MYDDKNTTIMRYCKTVCKTLKEVRKRIADANDIPFETTECHYDGECAGTCPKCESEVRYLEKQLDIRRMMGKAVTVVGVGVGLAALSSCKLVRIFGGPTAGAPVYEPLEGIITLPTDSVPQPETSCDSTAKAKAPKSMVVQTDTTQLLLGDIVEEQPTFPGGQSALIQFIQDNTVYPKECVKDSIQGRVVASFIIECDGSITEAQIVRSLHPLLDAEALRIISIMPKWERHSEIGPVRRIKYTLPFSFKL